MLVQWNIDGLLSLNEIGKILQGVQQAVQQSRSEQIT